MEYFWAMAQLALTVSLFILVFIGICEIYKGLVKHNNGDTNE